MFATLGRSWEFAKISYGMIWHNKRLMVFPLLSTVAAILVLASFVLPLWQSGTWAQWTSPADSGAATGTANVTMWVVLFLFYFCNYFVIVFFNAALTACAFQAMDGTPASVSYGLSQALRRLPQIAGWALISAVVGMLLRALERNRKGAAIIASVLGMMWTVVSYFIIPVMVIEGVGPIEALKRSTRTLKATWGEALVGNFSLGLFGFLVMLPLIILTVLAVAAAVAGGGVGAIALACLCGLALALGVAATSAADVAFKVVIYAYASGRSLPREANPGALADAFAREG
jgi:hypothetical protein